MKNHPARLEPGKGKYMLYFILNERAVKHDHSFLFYHSKSQYCSCAIHCARRPQLWSSDGHFKKNANLAIARGRAVRLTPAPHSRGGSLTFWVDWFAFFAISASNSLQKSSATNFRKSLSVICFSATKLLIFNKITKRNGN